MSNPQYKAVNYDMDQVTEFINLGKFKHRMLNT